MLTQKELAKRIGVSQQAVSFALNGGGTLKQATRDYIVEEAQKAGYRVNAASRLFRDGRTNSVALIVDGNFHALPLLMLSAIRPVLRERDMHLTLFGAEAADFADPLNPPRLVRELSVDGFLVYYNGAKSGELSQQIAHYRIPSVWINQKRPHHSVYPDDFGISSQLVEELANRSKGSFLYLGPEEKPTAHYSVADRQNGFLEGLKKTGRPGEVVVLPSDPDGIHELVLSILQRKGGRPGIVITYRVEDAQAFYLQASILGIRMPEDLHICTYSSMRAQIAHHQISRVLVPLHSCGIHAVDMLLKRIEAPKREFPSIAVKEFDFKDSVEADAVMRAFS